MFRKETSGGPGICTAAPMPYGRVFVMLSSGRTVSGPLPAGEEAQAFLVEMRDLVDRRDPAGPGHISFNTDMGWVVVPLSAIECLGLEGIWDTGERKGTA